MIPEKLSGGHRPLLLQLDLKPLEGAVNKTVKPEKRSSGGRPPANIAKATKKWWDPVRDKFADLAGRGFTEEAWGIWNSAAERILREAAISPEVGRGQAMKGFPARGQPPRFKADQ